MFHNRKNTKEGPKLFPAFTAAVILFVAIAAFHISGGTLEGTGENAAMFSAVLSMPGSGLDMLRERFRSELYEGDGEAGQAPGRDASDWPPPQVLAPEQERSPPAAPESSSQSDSSRPPVRMPSIPDKYAAPVISENFAGYKDGAWVQWRDAFLKNDTQQEDEDILEILETPWGAELADPAVSSEPQVLIVHTHATEGYEKFDRASYDTRNTWRSTDNAGNMVAVGDAMARVLEDNGIAVLHDTTQHDYPSYNGSYERSAETIQGYLDEYPSIKIVLDVHRDAILRDDSVVKPVTVIDGKKAAQIMIIAACDDDGAMGVPEWRENLRFAALFQDYMEKDYRELTRPVFFCYRKYNMDLTTGSLLLEFGSNANTLDEAVYSAELAGEALSKLILAEAQDAPD